MDKQKRPRWKTGCIVSLVIMAVLIALSFIIVILVSFALFTEQNTMGLLLANAIGALETLVNIWFWGSLIVVGILYFMDR